MFEELGVLHQAWTRLLHRNPNTPSYTEDACQGKPGHDPGIQTGVQQEQFYKQSSWNWLKYIDLCISCNITTMHAYMHVFYYKTNDTAVHHTLHMHAHLDDKSRVALLRLTDGSSKFPNGLAIERPLVPRLSQIQLLHGGPPCKHPPAQIRRQLCRSRRNPGLGTPNATGPLPHWRDWWITQDHCARQDKPLNIPIKYDTVW